MSSKQSLFPRRQDGDGSDSSSSGRDESVSSSSTALFASRPSSKQLNSKKIVPSTKPPPPNYGRGISDAQPGGRQKSVSSLSTNNGPGNSNVLPVGRHKNLSRQKMNHRRLTPISTTTTTTTTTTMDANCRTNVGGQRDIGGGSGRGLSIRRDGRSGGTSTGQGGSSVARRSSQSSTDPKKFSPQAYSIRKFADVGSRSDRSPAGGLDSTTDRNTKESTKSTTTISRIAKERIKKLEEKRANKSTKSKKSTTSVASTENRGARTSNKLAVSSLSSPTEKNATKSNTSESSTEGRHKKDLPITSKPPSATTPTSYNTKELVGGHQRGGGSGRQPNRPRQESMGRDRHSSHHPSSSRGHAEESTQHKLAVEEAKRRQRQRQRAQRRMTDNQPSTPCGERRGEQPQQQQHNTDHNSRKKSGAVSVGSRPGGTSSDRFTSRSQITTRPSTLVSTTTNSTPTLKYLHRKVADAFFITASTNVKKDATIRFGTVTRGTYRRNQNFEWVEYDATYYGGDGLRSLPTITQRGLTEHQVEERISYATAISDLLLPSHCTTTVDTPYTGSRQAGVGIGATTMAAATTANTPSHDAGGDSRRNEISGSASSTVSQKSSALADVANINHDNLSMAEDTVTSRQANVTMKYRKRQEEGRRVMSGVTENAGRGTDEDDDALYLDLLQEHIGSFDLSESSEDVGGEEMKNIFDCPFIDGYGLLILSSPTAEDDPLTKSMTDGLTPIPFSSLGEDDE